METGENLLADSESNTPEFKPNVLGLMKFSWERIICTKKIKCLKDALNESEPLVGTLDLVGISSKLSSYTTLDEYLADVDCLIGSCETRFKGKPDLLEAIKTLSENCHRDVESIRKCSECFNAWCMDRFSYFTRVCSKPHLLVYAKIPGSPFWPAKVMLIKGDSVNVEFFGDHSQADVSAKDCLLYSECLPGRKTKQDDFVRAKLEVDKHIKNIKDKFGTFNPAGYNRVLNPRMYERQLFNMIPGAFAGSSSLGNGYQYRMEWVEVQPDCDFDDSILDVIASSMASNHDSTDENNGQRSSGKRYQTDDKRRVKKERETERKMDKRQAKRCTVNEGQGKERRTEQHQVKQRHVAKEQAKERRPNESQLEEIQPGERKGIKQHGSGEENQSGDRKQLERNSPPANDRSSMSQSTTGNTTYESNIQHEAVTSTENQATKRARKTFPGPMPQLGRPKNPTHMDRTAMSRKIAELEMERDKILQQNRIYEEQISKLNEQLQKNGNGTVCATCGKFTDEPYFCNKICQLNFD